MAFWRKCSANGGSLVSINSLKHRLLLNVFQIIDKLLNSVPYAEQALAVLKRVIEINKPDVTLRYGGGRTGNTRLSRDIYNTMIHEFSHATHYWSMVQQQFGPAGSQYWWENIKYVIGRELAGVGPYGNKTDNGAERTAVIEAWGFFSGNFINARKYLAFGAAGNNVSNSEMRFIENQQPVDNVDVVNAFNLNGTGINGSRGWIPYGMHNDLIDIGEITAATNVTDNTQGFTYQQCFRALRTNVVTIRGYQQQFLQQTGNVQAAQINQLITDYRY